MGTDDGLEASYPLVFFDAARVKIRDEGLVRNRASPRRPGRWDEGSSGPLDRKHRRGQRIHERRLGQAATRHRRIIPFGRGSLSAEQERKLPTLSFNPP
jgi:hypothetical protein